MWLELIFIAFYYCFLFRNVFMKGKNFFILYFTFIWINSLSLFIVQKLIFFIHKISLIVRAIYIHYWEMIFYISQTINWNLIFQDVWIFKLSNLCTLRLIRNVLINFNTIFFERWISRLIFYLVFIAQI